MSDDVKFSATGSQPPRPEWEEWTTWAEGYAAAFSFLRYRDKILRTLEYISTNAGSNDHGVEIAEMATGLLGDLGLE